ncbi:MAG: hypothetical protein NT140_05650 [Deltaproteobacteria bacterium]|nr:hypothetical protein [Deltaproteobacteria bacterium]
MANNDFRIQLEKLLKELLLFLREKSNPIVTRIKTLSLEREKELLERIEMLQADLINDEKEFDETIDNLETMVKEMDQTNKATIKLKNKLGVIRKKVKENSVKVRGKAISAGIWKAKHDNLIEVLGDIYEICETSRSENIDYLKSKIKKISKEFVVSK